MKTRRQEEQFLDYIEGTLSPVERAKLESSLREDAELRAAFQAYQRVLAVERLLAGETHEAAPHFAVKVMDRIDEQQGFMERLSMFLRSKHRVLVQGVAFAATLVVVLVLARKVPESEYSRVPQSEAGKQEAPSVPSAAEPQAAPSPQRDLIQALKNDRDSAPHDARTLDKLTASTVDRNSTTESDTVRRMEEVRRQLDEKPKDKAQAPASSIQEKPSVVAPRREQIEQRAVDAEERSPSLGRSNGGQGAPSESRKEWSQPALDGARPEPAAKSLELEAQRSTNAPAPGKGIFIAGQPAAKGEAKNEGVSVTLSDLVAAPKNEIRSRAAKPVLEKKRALPNEQAAADAVAPAPYRQPVSPGGYIVPSVPYTPSSRVPADDADNYKGYEEQPRVQAKDEPMSTFSVDVDTASYSNARRFLSAGNLPPKESVRIEEFINYFDYSYPSQTEKPFELTYEIAPSPLEKDRLFLLLGIKAREAKAESKPWNLVFLIDTSGSMAPQDRLELIKKGLHVLVSNMRPNDRVSIVTYAGSAGVLLDGVSAKESARILSAIDSLGSGGGTNGEGGIRLAYEIAERNRIAGGVNRVVLATDGDFNIGISSQDELTRLIERERSTGVTLTTLGVGNNNLKDARLEQLADKGNGNYYFLDSFQEARHVLGEKIAGTMEVVAKDVKLQIEFNPEHVAQYRLIGYDNRKLKKEDFNNDAVDAGEIGVGHTVTAIYEVVLTNTDLAKKLVSEYRYRGSEAPKPGSEVARKDLTPELAFLKIRYKEPEAVQSQLLEFPIDVAKVKTTSEQASNDFRFASAVAYFGTLLRGSAYAGQYSYNDIVALAEKALGEDRNGQRREFINLVKNAAATTGFRISED